MTLVSASKKTLYDKLYIDWSGVKLQGTFIRTYPSKTKKIVSYSHTFNYKKSDFWLTALSLTYTAHYLINKQAHVKDKLPDNETFGQFCHLYHIENHIQFSEISNKFTIY